MNETVEDVVRRLHREAVDRSRRDGMPIRPTQPEPPAVHFTQLLQAQPGEALAEEWDTYRQEVARLLEKGHAGQFVLIKGNEVVGLYDTWEAARTAGLQRYLMEPFFVHPIRAEEPYLRLRGINFPCPS
jgi:hypothetical protein